MKVSCGFTVAVMIGFMPHRGESFIAGPARIGVPAAAARARSRIMCMSGK